MEGKDAMITRHIVFGVVLAGAILAVAAGMRYATSLDAVSADAARRATQVVIGLALAAYANTMPKTVSRSWVSVRAAARTQSALRVGGWSLTLAGLGYALLWAVAPVDLAHTAATGLVAAATLVTAGYGAWTAMSCRRAEGSPSAR